MVISLKDEFSSLIDENYKSVIRQIISVARQMNIKIYLIGGIVRDLILKTPIKDVDITVEGNAIDFCINLQNKFDCKIIAKQDNLKTAKVEFLPGIIIDFASTREEIYPKKGALPVIQNIGCNLKLDIKRRDFTINTLAIELCDEQKYLLVDYFDGYNDILNKKIRILHEKSFMDDPSRIIRALKFQMRLGFDIETSTKILMDEYLKNVDKAFPLERIKNELSQYFSINKSDIYNNLIQIKAYKLITDNPILNFNMKNYLRIKPYINSQNYQFVYFAHLLINSDFENQRLNLSASEKKILFEVNELLKNHKFNDNISIYNAYKNKQEYTPIIYYVITGDESVLKFYSELKDIKVLINGHDLINMGLKPSAYFNELFQKILEEKLNGNLQTKKEEIEFVKEIIL